MQKKKKVKYQCIYTGIWYRPRFATDVPQSMINDYGRSFFTWSRNGYSLYIGKIPIEVIAFCLLIILGAFSITSCGWNTLYLLAERAT